MPHAFTEDQLVEKPAIGLFAELDWTTVPLIHDTCRAGNLSLAHLLSGRAIS
jgi:type I restriction enzyme R subunit